MVEAKVLTFEELKSQLGAALASNNDDAILVAIGQMNKLKAEIAKAQAEAARKENEALAGEREKQSAKLFATISKAVPNILDMLAKVKAKGFTFYPDTPDMNGVITKAHVALLVPTVKTRKAGGGGGATGKSKEEYGMSLDEIFQANKDLMTAEQVADYAKAETEKNNTRMWQIKTSVKKAAIKEGSLQPK